MKEASKGKHAIAALEPFGVRVAMPECQGTRLRRTASAEYLSATHTRSNARRAQGSYRTQAIALWEEWEPDLIWMDMRMPVMDGYEATKYIKSTTKGAKTAIVALTASVLEEEIVVLLSAGCDDFVRKPFTEEMIFEILAKHLGVEYIYEESLSDETNTPTDNILTSDNLKVMSDEWILLLYQGSLEGDMNRVMQLIEEVPETETYLTQSLTKIVHQFQFEQLIKLTEPFITYDSKSH
jgi:CheY-like chemotaxis protein